MTAGDGQEKEAEVFRGVEVVVDHTVANPPSVLINLTLIRHIEAVPLVKIWN